MVDNSDSALVCMQGLRVGISLAVAIALHNIPEGLAVALPIYYATRNRWVAFRAAALSGLAEPLAVIVVGLLFPTNLAPELIEGMLAGGETMVLYSTVLYCMYAAYRSLSRSSPCMRCRGWRACVAGW